MQELKPCCECAMLERRLAEITDIIIDVRDRYELNTYSALIKGACTEILGRMSGVMRSGEHAAEGKPVAKGK